MKRWYASRTVWFNIGTGLAGLGTEVLHMLPLIFDAFPDVTSGYEGIIRLGLTVVISVGNVLLRLDTDKPIGK